MGGLPFIRGLPRRRIAAGRLIRGSSPEAPQEKKLGRSLAVRPVIACAISYANLLRRLLLRQVEALAELPDQGPGSPALRLANLGPPCHKESRNIVHLISVETTDRFAAFQAQWLNVHVDFPLLQPIALPTTIGAVRYPGIKVQDPRIIRLLEVLLHGGNKIRGWSAKQILQTVLTTFRLPKSQYGPNSLRYDLRELKAHGLLERDGSRYPYRLTTKGVQVALLFLFFHKRLCGPLANSRFHHRPDPAHQPPSKLEAAYHKADKAIQEIVNFLAAA